jgi:preprotein translocase subunit SecE
MSVSKKTSLSKHRQRDFLLWVGAVSIVLFALYLNMHYRSVALPVKLLSGLFVIALFCGTIKFTERGQEMFVMLHHSWQELYKVVWPSQQETLQTTLMVMVFVVIVACFLWILDAGVMFLVNYMLGLSLQQ